MESLNPSQPAKKNNNSANRNKPLIRDTTSAGRPKMPDNNDDNEFATTPLKASFTVESDKTPDRDQPVSGSAEKVDRSNVAKASKIEQKLESKMDNLAGLISRAGEKIQRMGEALCRIGDKVENIAKVNQRHSQ